MGSRRPDWDASAYHRISGPQFAWGQRVLERLSLTGSERVLDAGCGTGRLTTLLAGRLPKGRLIASDRSAAMTQTARRLLPAEVPVVRADLLALPFERAFDVIFSTATFHWVLDAPALYAQLFAALAPGGRLHAQCGGAGNLARLHARTHVLMRSTPFVARYADWREPWRFASAEQAAADLRAAGFIDVQCDLEPAPTPFADEAAYREFTDRVVLADYLSRLDAHEHTQMMDAITEQAAADDPPFTLDYVRLNLRARRPEEPRS